MNSFFRVDPIEPNDPLSNFEPVQYDSELQRALAEETVGEIQCKPFLQIHSLAPVRDAIEMLHDSGVSSLLVVDDEKLVGIFTERDVLEKVVERYVRVQFEPVENFMTADPTIIYDSDPAAAAAAAISVAGHRHVPVLNMEKHVTGMVSPRRIFDFMEKHF